jgi:hypothetical protein
MGIRKRSPARNEPVTLVRQKREIQFSMRKLLRGNGALTGKERKRDLAYIVTRKHEFEMVFNSTLLRHPCCGCALQYRPP